MEYKVSCIEEVFEDGELIARNPCSPVNVVASSLNEARKNGLGMAERAITQYRLEQGTLRQGDFIAKVVGAELLG